MQDTWPSFAADGKAVVFSVQSGADTRIDALVLSTGKRHTVVSRAQRPISAAGHLVFVRDNDLFVAPIDEATLRLTGPELRVLAIGGSWADLAPVDVSASGTLLYSPATAQSRLVSVSKDGTEQALNETLRPYAGPRFTPDGAGLIVQAADLWMQDLRRSTFTRIAPVDAVGAVAFPIVTPDGRHVVYRSLQGIRVIDADGSGNIQTLPATSVADYPAAVTPDGRTLVFLRSSEKTSYDIYAMPLAGGPAQPIVVTPAYDGGARLSPDGRWMIYVSNDSGRNEVYVRPFPGPERRRPISTEGGGQAVWSPTGREIFYRNGNRMMAVDVTERGDDIELGAPHVLFERRNAFGAGITIANYDVSPDGQHFVMVKDEAIASRIDLVLNWFAELDHARARR